MKLRKLGSSDLRISSIGVGCMNLGPMCDQPTADAIVNTAFDLGVNFFDVADIYGGTMGRSEAMLGICTRCRITEISCDIVAVLD